VPGARGVQQVARQHRIDAEAGESNAVPLEHHGIELQIVSDFLY
jgi:hypothetical protein